MGNRVCFSVAVSVTTMSAWWQGCGNRQHGVLRGGCCCMQTATLILCNDSRHMLQSTRSASPCWLTTPSQHARLPPLPACVLPVCLQGSADKEVARTLAAVQALEGSVRAGSAFYQRPQQQLELSALTPSPPPQLQQQQQRAPGSSSSGSKSRKKRPSKQASELCPQLVQQIQSCQNNSQKFIEATQKVGSLIYMAPEVLTGGREGLELGWVWLRWGWAGCALLCLAS